MGLRAYSGRFIAAILLLLAAFPAQAKTAAELNDLGIASYNEKRFEEAVALFEQAYELASDNNVIKHNLCNAHQELASILEKQNKNEEAVRHLVLAIGIHPENPSPLVQIGSYYLKLNQVSDAIFRLEEAIELKPGLVEAHFMLGEAYYQDNDLPSARTQWDFVLEMRPDWPGLREKYDKLFREANVEQNFNSSGTRHFQLSYPGDLPQSTRFKILSILERAYTETGRKLGGVYPPDTVKVVLYSAEQFTEATQLDSHVGALFDGKIRVPISDEQGRPLDEDDLSRRLNHEYVHVALRHLVGSNVPWWLNEGLAETLSRDMDSVRTQMLQAAYAQNLAFPLGQLEGGQLHKLNPDSLALAYAQAHATVNLLWTKYGQRRIVPMLRNLKDGMDPEEALNANFRKTYAVLEEEVANAYR
jgi:hypothetical protein